MFIFGDCCVNNPTEETKSTHIDDSGWQWVGEWSLQGAGIITEPIRLSGDILEPNTSRQLAVVLGPGESLLGLLC